MKSFLVAVDFSNCSINALMHAAQLAYLTNSGIEMIWVNNPKKTKVYVADSTSTGLINEMNVQFKHLADELLTKYPGLKVDYLIREGVIYKEIGLQAEKSKSQLIVAGTQGRIGLEKLWMGSNVYSLVRSAPCPVLTVRLGTAVSEQLKKIILPIDSTVETREKVTIAAELANAAHAKVVILKLYSTEVIEVRDSVDIYAQQVLDYLREENVEAEMVESEAKNLTVTTIEYAMKANANLIIIMTEQEKKVANFLIGNFAHQMMNTSTIPVLSVRPEGF